MRRYIETSDHELLQLLSEQEDAFAFKEIYDRYWDKMYSAAYKRLRSNETTEELVQDLFTDIWLRRKTLNITTDLPIYLYTAIRYKVINHVHHELVKNTYHQKVVLAARDFDNSTEETVIATDLSSMLETQVKLLPVKCREVFELSRNEHKSNKEIAHSLGISEKTVENHITKALRRLRTSLNTFLFF